LRQRQPWRNIGEHHAHAVPIPTRSTSLFGERPPAPRAFLHRVEHAIQPAFKQYTPYLVLLVELDTQSGMPQEADSACGNLTRPTAALAEE